MNKAFLIVILFFLPVLGEGQTNLVYNGDFELYDTCPVNVSAPWDYEIATCYGWNTPTYATSDYFNSCNSGPVGIPNNVVGSQTAFSGNGYLGFLAYSISGGGCGYTGSYWFEYVQGRFVNPLIAGHLYNFSFYVSLAEGSNIAISQIGLLISPLAVGSCNSVPLNFNPQIVSTASQYLNDTSGWTLISGNYTASGGEQYITIGNFKDSVTTDTISVLFNGDLPTSYYYIDAVSTFDLSEQNISVFTPNGDGINDLLDFSYLNLVESQVTIYNRWGKKVFESGQNNKTWDGRTADGANCSEGVYYYTVQSTGVTTKKYNIKGFVQLVR